MTSHRPTLAELEKRDDFVRRHIGPGEPQIDQMLKYIGLSSLEEMVEKTVPAQIRSETPLKVGPAISERDALSTLRIMSERNQVFTSMIGMGYYGTVTPTVILRNILENPGWYTAYTPYQPEVSQGRLEAILNFQQMVTDLTGMDLANASLLDEATAAAEAMSMMKRVSKSKSNRILVHHDMHPQSLAVLKTRTEPMGIDLVICDPFAMDLDAEDFYGVIVQNPGSSGEIRDVSAIADAAHGKKALLAVATDPLACSLMVPPGEQGADIVFGSSQRLGVPMGFGGPHAAFFGTKDAYKRSMPGRIIGVSVDSHGKTALRMALQTREQHIRREKATSNICTSQALLAVVAGMYGVYHGPDGLARIAGKIHRMTSILAEGLRRLGFDLVNENFFDTLTVRVPGIANRIAAKAREKRINLRVVDADHLGISLDETTRRRNLKALLTCFSTRALESLSIEDLDGEVKEGISGDLVRTSDFMTHPVFHLYHAETEMMRYMRWLAAKDIALDRAMIPLGSCTMKLNATSELIPITWRNFANLHPFAPQDQTQGYQQMFEELEEMLCDITGYDAISLQPNAGSQGEYAGLLTIRKYHEACGEGHRNICLIPSSAHGTNPASSTMAGLDVVVVGCDDDGNVDVAHLKEMAEKHSNNLAALMVTYPSTHGVFEEQIREICDIVHDHGGQVYLDGANMNAMVGLVRPGKIGADVSHLNLHKTFAIPHGGGGPGMGPIGVGAHLAPYLPDHNVVSGVNPAKGDAGTIGTVSAAPHGSAMILPISWAYCKMLGDEGLKRSTEIAILGANYIAERLKDHYPVLYKGENGFVAHECIIDLSGLKETSGITNEDVAKRLVDYGFHAPTMSFPVVDTLMIEPTESEAMRELDRFCDALIKIREEIRDIEEGRADREDNLLVNAPHTHHLMLDDWKHPYSKADAFFPLETSREDKFWPPVGRVDNVYGDRNLICSCPPMSAYQQAAE